MAKKTPTASKRSKPAKRVPRQAPQRASKRGVLTKPSAVASVSSESVLLLGDERLVQEYRTFLTSNGFAVHTSVPRTGSKISYAIECTNLDRTAKRERLTILDRVLSPDRVLLSSSVTVSATEQANWITHRNRLVGFGILPTLSQRPLVELAPTIHSPTEAVEQAAEFFARIGKQTEVVQDRVGLVFARTLCRLINEAAFALTEEIATPQDLDAALKMALQHPNGPIEWVERIGLDQVSALLKALESESGDARYRMAPLLHQMALSGEWWKR